MTETHIPDIMASGHFASAQTSTSDDEALGAPVPPGWVHYQTRYIAKSPEALQAYLTLDAPALRADFLEHCPADAKISLRICTTRRE